MVGSGWALQARPQDTDLQQVVCSCVTHSPVRLLHPGVPMRVPKPCQPSLTAEMCHCPGTGHAANSAGVETRGLLDGIPNEWVLPG